tara:strand:- start:171 stop:383 length:213 start_codon:yes stop_codon:yes gene_type:complete
MKIKKEDIITKWQWVNLTTAFKDDKIRLEEFVDLIESFGRAQSLLYSKKELNEKNSNDYNTWRKNTQQIK